MHHYVALQRCMTSSGWAGTSPSLVPSATRATGVLRITLLNYGGSSVNVAILARTRGG